MENKNRKNIKKITQLALFLALGIVLNIVESLIPLPFSVPGIRLGLANIIGLILLYYYSPKEYVLINGLRVLLVGLIRTGLFSTTFLLSLSGWALSTLVVLLFYHFKLLSIFGLSSIAAVFHSIGQIIVVMIIYQTWGYIYYLGILLITSVISGLLTAFISSLVLKKLDHHIEFIN